MTSSQLHHRGDELHLLREVMRTHQTMMTTFSHAMGRPASHFAVLRSLALSERDQGVTGIANSLGINAAAVTRIVQELESEKLVQGQPDPRDGRRRHLVLTRKGRTLFEEMHTRSHALERRLVAEIGAEAMADAAAVLARLRQSIEETART